MRTVAASTLQKVGIMRGREQRVVIRSWIILGVPVIVSSGALQRKYSVLITWRGVERVQM